MPEMDFKLKRADNDFLNEQSETDDCLAQTGLLQLDLSTCQLVIHYFKNKGSNEYTSWQMN